MLKTSARPRKQRFSLNVMGQLTLGENAFLTGVPHNNWLLIRALCLYTDKLVEHDKEAKTKVDRIGEKVVKALNKAPRVLALATLQKQLMNTVENIIQDAIDSGNAHFEELH